MLIFSGCSNSKVSDIDFCTNGFNCEFSLIDSDISGELTVSDNGECLFVFDSPTELIGTEITVNNEAVFIKSDGYTKKFDPKDIPQYSFALNVHNALLSVNVTRLNDKSGKLTIEGISDSGNFSIEFNQAGLPIFVDCPDIPATVKFSNTIKR